MARPRSAIELSGDVAGRTSRAGRRFGTLPSCAAKLPHASVPAAATTARSPAIAACLPRLISAPGRPRRRRGNDGAALRIEIEWREVRLAREVEQAAQAPRGRVERSAAESLAAEPVVFDETEDGGLRDLRVIDVVDARPRRDDEERKPRTRATAAIHWLVRSDAALLTRRASHAALA